MNENFERDPLIDRVRDTLRAAPAAEPDPRAVGRVLATVWASPRPSLWRRVSDMVRVTTFTRLGAATVAGAALLLGYVSRTAVGPESQPMTATGASVPQTPVVLANDVAGAELAVVQTQFVHEDAKARSVSLVGDFNGWKAGETPLVRLDNGLWTTTVPLPAGRHVYAFMIDDTLLVADPRAPKAGDADYGREGSVVMVFTR